jgi:hypothetical protein
MTPFAIDGTEVVVCHGIMLFILAKDENYTAFCRERDAIVLELWVKVAHLYLFLYRSKLVEKDAKAHFNREKPICISSERRLHVAAVTQKALAVAAGIVGDFVTLAGRHCGRGGG